MTDLHERLSGSCEHVRPRWTPERERRIEHRLTRALARPRFQVARAAALSIVAAGLYALTWHGAPASFLHDARVMPLERMRPVHVPLLVLEDGSAVTARAAETRLQSLRVSAGAVSLHLLSGTARFEVTPNPRRVFQVQARDATVTVLGTVFDVALRGDALHVTVDRGRVRVEHGTKTRELMAGEKLTWTVPSRAAKSPAPAVAPVTPSHTPDLSASRAPARSSVLPPAANARREWRDLAARREYQAAYERLSADAFASVGEDPGELLLAADVARLSGHAADAVPLLERVADFGAKDARAALAAFALGRVLLDDLGQPARAARAFRRAYELSPRGALAEDALRREVTSLKKAGEHAAAERKARAYREQFPDSDR